MEVGVFVLIVTIFVAGNDGKALSASGFSAGPFANLAACQNAGRPFQSREANITYRTGCLPLQ